MKSRSKINIGFSALVFFGIFEIIIKKLLQSHGSKYRINQRVLFPSARLFPMGVGLKIISDCLGKRSVIAISHQLSSPWLQRAKIHRTVRKCNWINLSAYASRSIIVFPTGPNRHQIALIRNQSVKERN